MPKLIVYRDAILPKSELAFMQRQYSAFTTLQPVWVGRRLEPWLKPGTLPLGPVLDGMEGTLFKMFGIVPQMKDLVALDAVCVHAQFGRGGALALPLARALNLPLVVTMHGGEDKHAHYRRFPIPALFRLRMRRLQEYASLFVCVSTGVRDRLAARGFPRSKMTVLPIGTDTLLPEPRKERGTGICFVGRFVEMKGLPVLIDAISRLRARGCNEPFVLIGDGPDRAQVEHALAGIPNVELCGWQPPEKVRQALLAARALCIPSIRARSGEIEGLPSVAVEAAGLGVPVIASSEAGVADLIADGISGRIFESRNAEALSDCIMELIASPERGYAMARTAHEIASRDFNARTQSRHLESLLLSVSVHPRASSRIFATEGENHAEA